MKSNFILAISFLVVSCGGASSNEVSKSVDVGAQRQDGGADEAVDTETGEGRAVLETRDESLEKCSGDAVFQQGKNRCWQMCFQGRKQGGAGCEGRSSQYLSSKKADKVCRSHRKGCRLPTVFELGEVLGDCEHEVIHLGNKQCAGCKAGDICAKMLDEPTSEIVFWTRDGGDSKHNKWKSTVDGIKLYELTGGMRIGFYCICESILSEPLSSQ
ncbi:MAG: hypothetical protein GY854_18790 [Deltaproteobacteria bacterium]|nr:hypothetical protein [Deltaproteobacteria bacterium]